MSFRWPFVFAIQEPQSSLDMVRESFLYFIIRSEEKRRRGGEINSPLQGRPELVPTRSGGQQAGLKSGLYMGLGPGQTAQALPASG